MKKKKLNRKALKMDQTAIGRLLELFVFVNNINKTPDLALRGGVYKEIAKADIFTQSFDGWEVGYKLEDHGMFMRRKIYFKCQQPLDEVPHEQADPVFTAVLDVFLEKGQDIPIVTQISPFAVLVEQDVIPLLMVEKNPRLLSKGQLIGPN